MKILTPALLLFLSALSAQAQTYLAEGVSLNLGESTLFYDSGKAKFWAGTSSVSPSMPVYQGVSRYFDGKVTAVEVLEDVGKYVPSIYAEYTFNSYKLYNDIRREDGLSCWYHSAANVIEYWQQSYGVFAEKQAVSGLSYSRDKLVDFGGTQSLDMSLLFFDHLDGGKYGNFGVAAEWYLAGSKGVSYSGYLKDGVTMGDGGYYSKYFHQSTGSGDLSSYDSVDLYDAGSIDTFTKRLATAFGYNSSMEKVTKGQIAALSLNSGDATGHIVTCYGFEIVKDNPDVIKLFLADSDDESYELVEVYAFYEGGKFMLYSDLGKRESWTTYGENGWEVQFAQYIATPDSLKQLEASYSDADTEQVWSGGMTIWGGDDASDDGGSATYNSGWVRYARNTEDSSFDGYFHSKYESGRAAAFTDYYEGEAVTQRTVSLVGNVSVDSMRIENDSIAYTFEGAHNSITADSLIKEGSNSATFSKTTLDVKSVAINEGSLVLHESTVNGSVEVEAGATLSITGVNNVIKQNLTMNAGSTLHFTSTSSELLVQGDLALVEGVAFSGEVGTLALQGTLYLMDAAPTAAAARALSIDMQSLLRSGDADAGIDLNANLDLTKADGIVANTTLSVGGDLILGTDKQLTLSLADASMMDENGYLTIFSDVSNVIIGTTSAGADANYLNYFSLSPESTALIGEGAELKFDDAKGTFYIDTKKEAVPEPSSGMLTLAALAGALLRRRRKRQA